MLLATARRLFQQVIRPSPCRPIRARSPQAARKPLRLEALEDHTLLATVTWISPTGGDWATAGAWSTGSLPGAGDDVVIPTLGSGISITHSGGSDRVQSVRSGRNIALSRGTLTVRRNLQESTGTA